SAVMGFDGESAIGPQLPLGAESVWRLQQGHQQRGANRTDGRNLAQTPHRRMSAALSDQIVARLMMQGAEEIELLIEPFCAPTNSSLGNLAQPFAAMPCGINPAATAGNRPTAIQRFDASHHPCQILGERQIAARQLLQGSYSVVSLIHRAQ